MPDPIYTIDGIAKAGNPIVTHSYAANQVTLSELLNDTTITREALQENIQQIEFWVSLIKEKLDPNLNQARSDFSDFIKKKNGKVDCDYRLDSDKLTDATYDSGTKLVTFKARSQKVLVFVDFLAWISAINRYRNEISAF